MKTYIYILQDPNTQEVRYVGKTKNPKHRYYQHVNLKMLKKKKKCYLSSWLISLLDKKIKPIFTIIDEIEGNWEWLEQYWIAQFKNWGFKLTNLAEGGQGGNNYSRSEQTKKLISKNNARGNAVLTETEVLLAWKLINQGLKGRKIKKQIPNIKPHMIWNIKNGKSWSNLTGKKLDAKYKSK